MLLHESFSSMLLIQQCLNLGCFEAFRDQKNNIISLYSFFVRRKSKTHCYAEAGPIIETSKKQSKGNIYYTGHPICSPWGLQSNGYRTSLLAPRTNIAYSVRTVLFFILSFYLISFTENLQGTVVPMAL